MKSNSLSAKQLIDWFSDQKCLDEQQVSTIQHFILNDYKYPTSSLYVKVLLNIGAFFSSLYLVSFVLSLLGAFRLIGEHSQGLIIWGISFVLFAIMIHKDDPADDNSLSYLFNTQLSLISMATGKILFTLGILALFDHSHKFNFIDFGWLISLTILLCTLVVYPFYNLAIDRFLSIFVLLISMIFNLQQTGYIILMDLFFILQLAGLIFLLTNDRLTNTLPFVYALVFSLCSLILSMVLSSNPILSGLLKTNATHVLIINMALTLGLIVSIGYISSHLEKLKSEAFLLAILGAILLGLLSATGISFAFILLILGREKEDRLLSVVGGVFLAIFLFFYYYNLSLTLAYKSAILVGSGVILLLGSWYIKSRGFFEEVV